MGRDFMAFRWRFLEMRSEQTNNFSFLKQLHIEWNIFTHNNAFLTPVSKFIDPLIGLMKAMQCGKVESVKGIIMKA